MRHIHSISLLLLLVISPSTFSAEWPGPTKEGYELPNGWRITPVGKSVETNDLILNLVPTPDGRGVVALTCGYNPHSLVIIDAASGEVRQRVPVPTAWFGLAWSPDGSKLYVSGGNDKRSKESRAPIYVFEYRDEILSETPLAHLKQDLPQAEIFWSGLAHHPQKDLLYAANRERNEIVVFDTKTGESVGRVGVERNPCDLVLTSDGKTLYCSNWAADTVSVIDTNSMKTTATIGVGDNPTDMVLSSKGILYVCCSNDNAVTLVDTAKGRAIGTIVTSLYERAPEGSTPNALCLDPEEETLYVANADNNNICVVDVEEPEETTVLGFIPAGWYPSALAVSPDGKKLFIGNSKGLGSYPTPQGPRRPNPKENEKTETIKTLMEGAVNTLEIDEYRSRLPELTRQVYANCPYNDELLAQAAPTSGTPSVVPSVVGAGSPIKHVLYIIKENRTYDQVFGDLPQGNGDPNLCLFGKETTPNHHAIAEQFVLFDNLYCDAEVSADGHQWSNAAYATDYVEKSWPAAYGGQSLAPRSQAMIPPSGYLWDQCAMKGLTYRTYGEFAERQSEKGTMKPINAAFARLEGHIAPNYLSWGARDTENAAEFIREFDEYDKNFDNPDPEKRLPNFIVLALPEDHTHGTSPDKPTTRACVASNDYALGQILDRVSHSHYWPEMAVFTIEDDAQDGPDHVDARRTVGLLASPYARRGYVDSTHYTTCSVLRTIELLLGLQPMSQYDAAATPMYAAFTDQAHPVEYAHLKPNIDLDERNPKTAWGAEESLRMDFSEYDRAPMFALNEIIWKSVKGTDTECPLPIHRFRFSGPIPVH
ncbi:MAG: bifunctional YncE family protein/alkaline phosphatase family protein [Candidatus Omnitrophica bacterium]|nr:bifunctional YncE family protein/alkaline phosphatase family protein [Candidatus Omnitrophota bacterium]